MLAGLTLLTLVNLDLSEIYGGLFLFFFAMNGVIATTSTAAALDLVPEMASSASALLGALQ